ncbi:MAG: M15 family metallopeptidase, partial [Acidimicrobiia bacterium]
MSKKALVLAFLVACSSPSNLEPPPSNLEPPTSLPPTSHETPITASSPPTTTAPPTTTTAPLGTVRPDWLGTRLLEVRPDGLGVPQPTPPELINRRFPSPDLLPPPVGAEFEWTAGPVPDDVVARSSWREECPVAVEDLTYLTLAFWGFDGQAHTGEMITNSSFATGVAEAFQALWEIRFPIEEIRV